MTSFLVNIFCQLSLSFSLSVFLSLGCHHITFALWYIAGRILNMCSPRPYHGFFLTHSTPHAQFFPRYPPISFHDGFSRLLSLTYAHDVVFSSHILLLTPSFLSATYTLASSLGFLAFFSLPTPTTWVFSLANTRAHPFNKMYLTM